MNEKLKRYLIFLVGLFVNAVGVSLITKGGLGTSPISSIPYVLSLNFPFTLGNFTIVFSLLLIALQIIILRKNFKLEYLLQIPVSIAFGYFIDFTMFLLKWFNPTTYPVKFIGLLVGCVILGIGVWMEVLANVVMLPGESFVRAVNTTWNLEFGTVKICFDTSLALIAAAMSFILAHQLQGVREGTIIAALLVGMIARKVGKICAPVQQMLFPETEEATAENEAAPGGVVIALGREFGCGGREMGKAVAEHFGMEYYDRELIHEIAKSTGYTDDFVEKKEENMTGSLLYDFVNEMYGYSSDEKAPKDKIFQAQHDVIRSIAQKGNCVIVGRMADYILKDDKNCVRVFLHASDAYKMKNVQTRENLSDEAAMSLIHKKEHDRAENYKYFTRQTWGLAKNYDLSFDCELGKDALMKMLETTLVVKGHR